MKIHYGITFDLCRQQYIVSVDGVLRVTTFHLTEAFGLVAKDLREQVGSANYVIRQETDEFFHAVQLHEQAHSEAESSSEPEEIPEEEVEEEQEEGESEPFECSAEESSLTEREAAYVEQRLAALGISL
jgi:hypothetical protein